MYNVYTKNFFGNFVDIPMSFMIFCEKKIYIFEKNPGLSKIFPISILGKTLFLKVRYEFFYS